MTNFTLLLGAFLSVASAQLAHVPVRERNGDTVVQPNKEFGRRQKNNNLRSNNNSWLQRQLEVGSMSMSMPDETVDTTTDGVGAAPPAPVSAEADIITTTPLPLTLCMPDDALYPCPEGSKCDCWLNCNLCLFAPCGTCQLE